MKIAHTFSAFALSLPLIALAGPSGIHRDMPFAHARSQLTQAKWKPVNLHLRDDGSLMGVEHELLKQRIREFESCSIDYSYCVMRYRRGKACLTLYTQGEHVDVMKVLNWSNECVTQR